MPDFLQKLNLSLEKLELEMPIDVDPPKSIFIIGVPRSGTTLVSQLLSSCTNVGYVNNLMARFWLAPAVGARLSREVLKRRIFTGKSEFGQTGCVEEPHEFGAFWRYVLKYENMSQKETDKGIDWDDLTEKIKKVATVFGKPVVYKVFQLYWHLEKFHSHLPTSKWIWVKRNPVDNALSLLEMRKEKTGSFENWFSARPIGATKYDCEPPWVQVVAQVKLIEDWIENQLAQIPAEDSFKVELEKLCNEPDMVVAELAEELELPIIKNNLTFIKEKIISEVFSEEINFFKKRIEQAFQTIRK